MPASHAKLALTAGAGGGRPIPAEVPKLRLDAVAAPPFGSTERFPMLHSPLDRRRLFNVPTDF
jgi:hypothetical protein